MIRSYRVGSELHISSGYQDSCNESFYEPLRAAPSLLRSMSSALADGAHAGVGVVLRLRDGSYFRHGYTVALGDENTDSRTPCSDPESAFRRARAAYGRAPRK